MLGLLRNNAGPPALLQKQLEAFQVSRRQLQAIRAWRYYDGTAYRPEYGGEMSHPYVEWDETVNGPRPVVQPLARILVEQSAQFLFSETPRFVAAGTESGRGLQRFLDEAIRMNSLEDRLLPEARACSIEGATVFKFAWTPQNRRRPVAIHTLSPGMVRFYRDAMDASQVRMARVQFKFADEEGDWWWFREDWTPERHTCYHPLRTSEHDDTPVFRQMENGRWPVREVRPNPFGLIPLRQIENRVVKSDPDGVGDFWDLYPMLDQYNHTCWLEHHSNQLDGDPIIAILNARFDGTLKPGMAVQLQGERADIKRLGTENSLRQWIKQYKEDLRRLIYKGAGYSDVNAEEITNKGNLTRAVSNLIFADSIRSTIEKRSYWGEGGLCLFFEDLLEGLSRLPDARRLFPALAGVDLSDHATYDVQCEWPEIVKPTPEERQQMIADASASVAAGFLTHERAARIAARAWEIRDVTALMDELAGQVRREA